MSVPIVKVFATGEKPLAEDLNAVLQTIAAKFGNLDGTDFLWPLVLSGDIDLSGNRMLRVREMFGALNLEEYGSDENAFEQAVNELSGGGLIFVPRNNVVQLSRSIKIRSNRQRVNIMGSGHSSQLRLADGADSAILALDGAKRFTISNMFLNGNKANNTAGNALRLVNCSDFVLENLWIGGTASSPGDAGCSQTAIELVNCRNFQIRRLWVSDTIGAGIKADGCEDFEISQCSIRDCSNQAIGQAGTAIICTDSRGGRIYSNDVRDCEWDGINLINCSDVRVFANHIRNCGDVGTWAQGESKESPSTGIFWQGNMISGCKKGLAVGANVQGQATGNHLRGNVEPISMSSDSLVGLQNNQVMDVRNHGVHTMPATSLYTNLDIGVAGLPIQSIQATWKTDKSTTDLQDSVLGAVYAVNGEHTVTFYTATALTYDVEFYYSIFI